MKAHSRTRRAAVLGSLVLISLISWRTWGRPLGLFEPTKPVPDIADIRYGPHDRNVLDLWQAKPKPGQPGPAPLVYMGPPVDPGQIEVRDGSRAVEVMAMFEDAIVETQHFTNPASGDVQGATIGLLITSGVALGGAFILFVVSFIQVAALQHAKEIWEKANPGKPINEFPMPHDGPLMDILVMC